LSGHEVARKFVSPSASFTARFLIEASPEERVLRKGEVDVGEPGRASRKSANGSALQRTTGRTGGAH